MDKKEMLRRLKAGEDPLEVSIRKWEDIVNGTGMELGEENCALCHTHSSDDCDGCPIALKTGESKCYDTPYMDYIEEDENTDDQKRCAKEELNFLKSLRKP